MSAERFAPWQVLQTRQVFKDPPWIDLTAQTVRTSTGRVVDNFYQLQLPNFVLVFAETPSREIIVIRQYKHGVGRVSLTFPGGLREPGEAPEEAARRELLEETGYEADDWKCLGEFVVNGNLGCGAGHFFRARNARQVKSANAGDLEEMDICFVDRESLLRSLQDGEVALLNHAALIGLAMLDPGERI